MKLKYLLNYLLENIDEAAIRGFSLDILKKKMPEFERLQYPEDIGIAIRKLVVQYGLPFLGKGSSRAVYALSTGKVLKIAINQNGIAQNEAEVAVSRNPSLKYIGARVYDWDDFYHWGVMEVAKIYDDSTQLKLDLGIPEVLSKSYGYNLEFAINDLRKIYEEDQSVESVIKIYYPSGTGPGLEEFRKYLEDPPRGMLALVDLTNKGLGDAKLEMGDIIPEHFGKTADGRPVLIDYGFTSGVNEEYYRSGSDDSYEGSAPPSSIVNRDEEEDISLSQRTSQAFRFPRRQKGISGEQV